MAEYNTKIGTGLINECYITNHSKSVKLDIEDQVDEIGYYESIFNPTVSFHVSITDASDIKNSLPIVGGERVDISFTDSFEGSPDIDGGYDDKPLRLYKLADREKINDRSERITLLCTSDHMMKNMYKSVDRSFRNQKASDIISKILETQFDDELFEFDETLGLHTYTFNRVPPFRAINQIIAEAESASTGSSCYFFFETNDGYFLRNLDDMLIQEPMTEKESGQKLVYRYIYGDIGGDNVSEGSRILDMRESVSFDLLNGVMQGQYGVRTNYFDPIRKRLASSTYLHNENWESTIHANPNSLITENISEEFGTEVSLENYMITNYLSLQSDYVSAREPIIRNTFRRKQNISGRRKSILSRITNNKIDIMVHGDSRIHAGATIDIEVPTTGQKGKSGDLIDRFTSGRYLVIAVQHNISDTRYRTVMTVVKDSYVKNPIRGSEEE